MLSLVDNLLGILRIVAIVYIVVFNFNVMLDSKQVTNTQLRMLIKQNRVYWHVFHKVLRHGLPENVLWLWRDRRSTPFQTWDTRLDWGMIWYLEERHNYMRRYHGRDERNGSFLGWDSFSSPSQDMIDQYDWQYSQCHRYSYSLMAVNVI